MEQSISVSSNRLRNSLWIVNTLLRYGKLTLKQINKLWLETDLSGGEEIIPRTFFNYRKIINDMFDIDIECEKKTNSYFISFEAQELVTQWLLSSFSVGQLLQQNKDISERIMLEDIPSGQHYLSTIIEAMRINKTIQITYQRFVSDEPHTFIIEPYCVKLFHQRWYVVANRPEKNRPLTYGLDRIIDMKISDQDYSIPADFDAQAFFHYSFGIFTVDNIPPQKIRIKVDASQRKYLRTLPLHHSQSEIISNQLFSIFEYELAPTQDFIMELLSHGAFYEVIEPESLRESMRQNAMKLFEIYK